MVLGASTPTNPLATLPEPGHVPGFCTPEARPFVLVSAILASAIGFIDGTVVAIALPAMRDTLDASLPQAQWINNGYLLPLSALILFGGALGDRLGLARVFATGICLFVLASMICAISPTAEILIAARVAQGIGAALMVPGSLALIARAYPPEERGRAIGIWAASAAMTTALGPIIGGLALSFGGPEMWRVIFAVNLPLGGIAVWLILTKVAQDPAQSGQRLDWPGVILTTLGLALIAVGLTDASQGSGTPNWSVTAIGAGIMITFLLWEGRCTHPMIPLALFKNPTFAAANGVTALIYFALTTMLFFLPMTVIAGWGVSELAASAAFAPLSIFITLMSGWVGKLVTRIGPGPLIGIGAALVGLSFAGLAITMPEQNFWYRVIPCTSLMGFGMALVVTPLSTAIMGAVSDEKSGTASGINNAVSRMAGLIAVASMGGLAGASYLAAGGPDSFGALSDGAGHASAMSSAFAQLAWITAALTTVGSVCAFVFIRKA